MLKLLVLTSRFPYPLEKGDKLRLYNQLSVLKNHFELVLISITDEKIETAQKSKVEELVSKLHIIPISGLERGWSLFQALFNGAPYRNQYFYSAKAKNKINSIIKEEKPDHVYCQLIRMADYIKDSNIPSTLDYMDAFSEGLKKRYSLEKGMWKYFYRSEYRRTLKYELAISKKLNSYTIISEQDRDKMPIDDVTIVKNGIDLNYFKPQETEINFDLVFVGNLGYYPNVQAAIYLSKKILPLLDSNKTLLLAGARPTAEVKSLTNNQIKLIPWVDDIRTAYSQARIFVAPLFVGIGQQNKILESMAMGIPCVTTSEVNNAIGAKADQEILIANTPEEFVAGINALNDPGKYQSIKNNALNFVKENYSWDKATAPLVKLIKNQHD